MDEDEVLVNAYGALRREKRGGGRQCRGNSGAERHERGNTAERMSPEQQKNTDNRDHLWSVSNHVHKKKTFTIFHSLHNLPHKIKVNKMGCTVSRILQFHITLSAS